MADPRIFGDRQKLVNAVHKYNETYGSYPENLKELKESQPDLKYTFYYHYVGHKDYFVVYYIGGLMDNDFYYNSETKEWIYISHKPGDPDYQRFEQLIDGIEVKK